MPPEAMITGPRGGPLQHQLCSTRPVTGFTSATLASMYLIAIPWLYVALLAAVADETAVGGVLTFIFYGLAPLALVLWLFGSPLRRRRQRELDRKAESDPGH